MRSKLLALLARLRPFALMLMPSIVIGALIGAYPGYKTYEYVWKNADFCTSCHVHDYATVGWKNSVHGQLTTCHDCHHQPLHQYAYELYVLIKDRPKFPKDLHHTPYVPKDLCQACHNTHPEDTSTVTGPLSQENIKRIPKIDQMYLHKVHLSKKVRMPLPSTLHVGDESEFGRFIKNPPEANAHLPERAITCVDCHGGPPNRAHHFSAADRSCAQCHGGVHNQKMVQETGCRSCHFQQFMIPIPTGTLLKNEPASH